MRELQECLDIKRVIDEINDEINEKRVAVSSPKNQIITGMPRSGSVENKFDAYLIKIERLEKRKTVLLEKQHNQWQMAMNKLPNITNTERELLKYRFIKGLQWKKCVDKLNEQHGVNWTIGKAFRFYGRINTIN